MKKDKDMVTTVDGMISVNDDDSIDVVLVYNDVDYKDLSKYDKHKIKKMLKKDCKMMKSEKKQMDSWIKQAYNDFKEVIDQENSVIESRSKDYQTSAIEMAYEYAIYKLSWMVVLNSKDIKKYEYDPMDEKNPDGKFIKFKDSDEKANFMNDMIEKMKDFKKNINKLIKDNDLEIDSKYKSEFDELLKYYENLDQNLTQTE